MAAIGRRGRGRGRRLNMLAIVRPRRTPGNCRSGFSIERQPGVHPPGRRARAAAGTPRQLPLGPVA